MKKPEEPPQLLDVRSVTQMLGVCRTTLTKLEHEKVLLPVRLGWRCIRYRRSDIEQFIASLSEARERARGRPRTRDEWGR